MGIKIGYVGGIIHAEDNVVSGIKIMKCSCGAGPFNSIQTWENHIDDCGDHVFPDSINPAETMTASKSAEYDGSIEKK